MFYFVKTPWLVKKYYSRCLWNFPRYKKKIYLSFDDGPHSTSTPFILDQLKKYQAKATFFCIGKNVATESALYKEVLDAGHKVGNHTHNHLNGWKSDDQKYFENIQQAAQYIDSSLFRPPYGRIRKFQLAYLSRDPLNYKVVMWDVLSGDFDQSISGDRCAENVIMNAKEGSIVIFHDSAKAFDRMKVALPKVLDYFSQKGFEFGLIS
jgi:peptidoglycan/xylan/chitin deacetylase (PgdA/CDA1 family)